MKKRFLIGLLLLLLLSTYSSKNSIDNQYKLKIKEIIVENNNILDDVAYMQVKDLSKNENEKVFIFNGWTFSSSPSIQVFDHPVYDLWILKCY